MHILLFSISNSDLIFYTNLSFLALAHQIAKSMILQIYHWRFYKNPLVKPENPYIYIFGYFKFIHEPYCFMSFIFALVTSMLPIIGIILMRKRWFLCSTSFHSSQSSLLTLRVEEYFCSAGFNVIGSDFPLK